MGLSANSFSELVDSICMEDILNLVYFKILLTCTPNVTVLVNKLLNS